MDLKERIKARIVELEKAEDEHREHNRILYANQSKLIRWELQGLLSDDSEGVGSNESKALPIQNVSVSLPIKLIQKVSEFNQRATKEFEHYSGYTGGTELSMACLIEELDKAFKGNER